VHFKLVRHLDMVRWALRCGILHHLVRAGGGIGAQSNFCAGIHLLCAAFVRVLVRARTRARTRCAGWCMVEGRAGIWCGNVREPCGLVRDSFVHHAGGSFVRCGHLVNVHMKMEVRAFLVHHDCGALRGILYELCGGQVLLVHR